MRIFRKNGDHPPWILRVPAVFRLDSSLIFIGILIALSGLAALLGYSDPRSITAELGYVIYKIWGGVLFLGGSGLLYGVFLGDSVVEKWCARILSICLLTFAAWAVTATSLQRSFLSVVLIAVIVFFFEQRISFINTARWLRRQSDDD